MGGRQPFACPAAPRSSIPRELSLHRGANPPASPGAAALPSEAAYSREEMQPNDSPLAERLYFRWKENNGKNKSKDHSDWKSIATLKCNNYNHTYWPSCRVRAHRQAHRLRWIATAPLTLPLHAWSRPLCSQNGHGIFLSFYCTKTPAILKSTFAVQLTFHLFYTSL